MSHAGGMLPSAAYRLAEAQCGILARFQLRRWLREDQIDHRIGPDRELRRRERGVYQLNGAESRPLHGALAAALRAGPRATISGPVALGRLGIDGLIDTELFEVLTAPGRRVRGVTFAHRRDPDPQRPVTRLGEIRFAAPVDALIDSAAFLGRIDERTLRLAYDQCRWKRLVRGDRLRRRIAELGAGAPGGATLLEVFELDGLEPESEGERLLGRLLAIFDAVPEPQVQVTPTRRVDWYFRKLRFAYEYLGSVDHVGVAARLADDARNAELRDQDIGIGYVTDADLKEPTALRASVIGRLAVRAHELGVPPPVARPLSSSDVLGSGR